MPDNDWVDYAVCPETDPEIFFAKGQYLMAKRICANCPVINECLTEALNDEIQYGTWGGQTTVERLAILRRVHGQQYQWPAAPSGYWDDFRRVKTGEMRAA